MLVKTEGSIVLKYPYTLRDVKKDYPNTSFPKTTGITGVTELGIFPITPSEVPPFSRDTEQLQEVDPVLVDGVWTQQWLVTSIVPVDPTELAEFKANLAAQKKNELAATRYAKEIAGITFNGMPVSTDRLSQAMLTGAYVTMQANPLKVIDWKGSAGWGQLNKAAIEALSNAIADYVQACFTNEKNISGLIDAATTVAELEAIDLNAGWPV